MNKDLLVRFDVNLNLKFATILRLQQNFKGLKFDMFYTNNFNSGTMFFGWDVKWCPVSKV